MARRKILMLTNCEFGQSNVFLSTAHALLEQDPDVEIHLASFPSLEKPAREALAAILSNRTNSTKDSFTFYPLPGPTMVDCLIRDKEPTKNFISVSLLKPGFENAPITSRFLVEKVLSPWDAEDLVVVFGAICAVIDSVSPDIVLVDSIFAPAMTAGKYMKKHGGKDFIHAVLSPNSVYDYVRHCQGLFSFLKWPMVGSALPMPIPWRSIPFNFYCLLRLAATFVGNKRRANLKAEARRLTGHPDLEVMDGVALISTNLDGFDRIFIGSQPGIDFPAIDLSGVPKDYLDKLVFCGPILRPPTEIDAELSSWLNRAPVVYINLGTHHMVLEKEALEMARSLRHMFDEDARRNQGSSSLQVLWKLNKDLKRDRDFEMGPGSTLHGVLGAEMDQDRVRVVDWLTSPPTSILKTGRVICSVTHGGANSYYEAVYAGVAQLVLPPWYDCYDYANKVEVLGIGRWGSQKGCPGWEESELKQMLVDVVLDKNAQYTANSRRLAEVCRKNGEGRVNAAESILRLLSS